MLGFDIESDGFIAQMTKVHCLCIKDNKTKENWSFTGKDIETGLRMLMDADMVAGHNIIKFDIPAIQKIYPWFEIDRRKTFDTLVIARLIWTDIWDADQRRVKQGLMPPAMANRHSLEAYGYRLGKMKGEYKTIFKAKAGPEYKPGDEWKELNADMLEYCVQDVEVTDALIDKIWEMNYSTIAIEIENNVQHFIAQCERNGFPFNEKEAWALHSILVERRGNVERGLMEIFGSWYRKKETVTPKVNNKTRGITKGIPYTKVDLIEFNPGSRHHIADRLMKLYGWKPLEFADKGAPKVDEKVISKLPYPPAKPLTEYLMVNKRMGQLADGDQAWLRMVVDGKIHGTITTGGAVTGRATHSKPNMSQVPKVGSAYGAECRALFMTLPGWILVGADASGLELRCLGHYMAKYDGGVYALAVVEGKSSDGTDVHTLNCRALGLEPHQEYTVGGKKAKGRDIAKTFIYALLYGAGDEKIGQILGVNKKEAKKIKDRFFDNLPALKKLVEAVKHAAKTKRQLKGLDGRILHVRSPHSALNTLLQSAGAILCKMWLSILQDELEAAGLKHGWDGDFALNIWSHDEVQISCRNQKIADQVSHLAEQCVIRAGERFNFRCPLAGESKQGLNWKDTH